MISDYIGAAMQMAQYEVPDDGTWFGTIPGFEGVWGNSESEADCVDDLQSALEGWILLGLHLRHPLPNV
ncbi:type II toxin-antitoxin system HicB family antitoxin [Altericista sp. CCNU0014]|uniref:type II toxin-antitoxin system HicB family antitoxin n=1 Tax=Altericista sp. CCNU0014 TaxID=3082949 RepID=UPI0038509B2F